MLRLHKDGTSWFETDINLCSPATTLKNMAKLCHRAMRGVQSRHAGHRLALHLQHAYLLLTGSRVLPVL